jgi:hypothetical protein
MNDQELKEIAYAKRTGLDLTIQWDPEELYQILQRANKLTTPLLHEFLKSVGVEFSGETLRENYLSALDEANNKENIYSFLDEHGA